MSFYPSLVMFPGDVADFDRLLDDIPHKHAKHLAEFINALMVRQAKSVEAIEQQITEAVASSRAQSVEAEPPSVADAVFDHYEAMCSAPPLPQTRH